MVQKIKVDKSYKIKWYLECAEKKNDYRDKQKWVYEHTHINDHRRDKIKKDFL